MSALGSDTQPDNVSDSNKTKDAKPGEDSDHQLSCENGSKKKKNSKCSSCCCCRGQNSDDELRASTKAAYNTERAIQTESIILETKGTDRRDQIEELIGETKGTDTPMNSPCSSPESSGSPAFDYKNPSHWPKKEVSGKDDDDNDLDDLEVPSVPSAVFRPLTSKLDLVGNDKKELELFERKRNGKDLVDDENSLVETLQLTKSGKSSNNSGEEKSVSQDEQFLSSDPKVPACFGCQKRGSTLSLKKS